MKNNLLFLPVTNSNVKSAFEKCSLNQYFSGVRLSFASKQETLQIMQSFEFISKYFCNTFGTKKRKKKNSLNVVSLLLGHQTQQRLYMLFIEPLLSVGIAEASCLNYVAW